MWKSKWGSKTSRSEEDSLITRENADEFKSEKAEKLQKCSQHKEDKLYFSDGPDDCKVTEVQKLMQDRRFKEVNSWLDQHKDRYSSLKKPIVNNMQTNPKQRTILDVDSLLEELKSNISSFSGTLPPEQEEFILLVYRVVELEDDRVAQLKEELETDSLESERTKDWKQQFTEIVKLFVQNQIPLFLKNGAENDVDKYVTKLQKIVLTNILSLSNKNEIFKIFAQAYHACIFHHLNQVFQADLDIEDLFNVLSWVTHKYKSEEFMGHPEIKDITLKASMLDPFLEARCVYSASEKLISTVQSEINVRLSRSLKMEDVTWSQLPAKIKQEMNHFIKKAEHISEAIALRIKSVCAAQLIDFLLSYPEHIKKSKDLSCRERMEIVASCIHFRCFLTELSHNDTDDFRKCLAVLRNVRTKECDELIEKIFYHVKICFSNHLKKDLDSNNLNKASSLIIDYFAQFSDMSTTGFYKTFVARAQFVIIQEYLRVIINSSLRCTSNNRSQISRKIVRDSKQLQQIFANLQSSATCLNQPILDVAEIIHINDINALKTEVAALVCNYPDVRKEHINAILDIRGMMTRKERRSILRQANDMMKFNNDISSDNQLFQGISVSKFRWRKNHCCMFCCIA
ncbi:exocyst complex component 3-like protein 2 isoform X1 [Hemiscyllium ocellatum]|uniref:exocyst complex component 3-like protein 2 isoform X1 n=1 Tax=Hemiscyllium ocellatum TaxID=170820 RepID=UPI002966ECFA|nr:exocyst complex component 3-like protein 2 isoform X1 [Hemiscyllium ocellatum]XP_060684466.1 exocyst complex component 3-like protein 2 isoform X1 [Hemiscyllium ocellatum]